VQMLIRGMGTVNNADPLVVVDGMPGVDINRLNMNDIESVSVLKDASSAAIYGSRAANGVILITTKSGKGEKGTRINATAASTVGKPTHAWEIMPDYPRTLTIQQRDAAVQTRPQDFRYKNGTIDQWMALGMVDPIRFPNTDWYDVVLRDATIQRYNVSATGGSDNSNFFVSLGILDEQGLLMNNNYSRYNGRINYNAKVASNINVGANFAGNWSEMLYAAGVGNFDGSIDANSMRFAIAGITPFDPETGRYGGVMAYGEDPMAANPYNDYTTRLTPQNRQEANTNVFMDWKPVKGLTARVDYALNYYNDFRYEAPMPSRAFNFQTGDYGSRVYVGENAGIYNFSTTGHKTQLTGRLNYDFQINDNHQFNSMTAYSQEYWYDRYLMAGRLNRLHPSLTEIDASIVDPDGQTMRGNSSTEGLASYIGRVNYVGYHKYLLEANLRYDGSSKFIDDYQWGFFPSASIGWLFTEEAFVQSIMGNWLYSGKIRASYGSLGNNSGVGRYQQRETLLNMPYIIDGSVVNGYVNSKMVNRDLSWEESTVTNVGLELSFFRGRLSTEVDVYDRLTTKMNRPSDLSIHLTGAYTPPPRRNIGSMRNRGIEGNFTWRDRGGEVGYMMNVVAAYNLTVLEEWNEYLGRGITSDGSFVFINMPYNYVYAYEAIGIAQSWSDIYNATPQGAQPGDILYRDLNGDGRIDNNDMRAYPYLQSDRPTTNFAFNGSIQWKGFDLALMLQGAAGRKTFWLTANNNPDVLNERAALTYDHWDKPWSWDNRDAEWARYGGWDNRRPSTFFLDNLAYLRLKNLQLGYNLPARYLVGLSSIRVYSSADNLATFTKFRGLDPEKGGNINDGYPLMRSFTFGVNIGI
jgi:TonB-dependent starch-binding outer membrane protein SusC